MFFSQRNLKFIHMTQPSLFYLCKNVNPIKQKHEVGGELIDWCKVPLKYLPYMFSSSSIRALICNWSQKIKTDPPLPKLYFHLSFRLCLSRVQIPGPFFPTVLDPSLIPFLPYHLRSFSYPLPSLPS